MKPFQNGFRLKKDDEYDRKSAYNRSITEGEAVKTALKIAAHAAALAVSKEGASVSIPQKQEVMQKIY